MAQETLHLVPAVEEALTPREHRLERGALVLRIRGDYQHGGDGADVPAGERQAAPG
ncbi:MAG: hypothetical protein U0694_23015 [Anaerolineae bacterium]